MISRDSNLDAARATGLNVAEALKHGGEVSRTRPLRRNARARALDREALEDILSRREADVRLQ